MSTLDTTRPSHWPNSAFHELWHRPAFQLPALDGLRALAVLLVISDHWVYEWATNSGLPNPSFVRFPFFYWGWTGVDLFFVLSGYLIGKQLWDELVRTGRIEILQFVLRRGLRIWPLYYATMLVLAIVPNAHSPRVPDLLMFSNYVVTPYARSWSLSTEEQFYLLVPLFLVTLRRFVAVRWWPFAVLLLVAAIPAARAITLQHLQSELLSPEQIAERMYYAIHLHAEPLLAGLLVAWIAVNHKRWLAPRQSRYGVAWSVIAAASAVAIAGLALRAQSREVFAYLGLACGYGAILSIALTDRSLATAVLRWPIWYPIARLSFGMYLNHLILREPTETIVKFANSILGIGTESAFLLGLIMCVLASAVTAAFTFILIEQPALAARERYFASRRSRTSTLEQ